MIVKAPSTLEWDDIVTVLTLIFDFKDVGALGMDWEICLRKGNIHAVVERGMNANMEGRLHKDLVRGPHHKVLRESKEPVGFKRELQTALKNWDDLKKTGFKLKGGFCPFHSMCLSFSEGSYLCTYWPRRIYADEEED